MRKRKSRKQKFKDIPVVDAGAKGKSIAKAPDGRVIFLQNAVPGDIVDIETYKKRKSYYEGKAIHFHKLSDKRVSPVCSHFNTCGGCKWQHMNYESQLFYKQQEVYHNLKHIGQLDLPLPLPIVPSENQYFYRNKMEFSFSDNRWLTIDEIENNNTIENRNALGFHIPGMWDKILDIDKCHLQKNPSNAIRNSIKTFAAKHHIPFFNLKNQTGMLRTLMIRTSSTGDLMVLIQFFSDLTDECIALLDFIIKTYPEITSLLYVVNKKANDTIYDQNVICYHGKDYIFEQMEGLSFKINAKSFYQTNSEQAFELYKITRDFAGLTGNELVYDLYTGTGTIAQFISKQAKKVVGIESVPEAIENAKANAMLNGIKNVDFFVGDMKTIFTDTFINTHGHPDVIITDPPRNGMHPNVVKQILNILPKRIVYVSCNSATQARDLALMKNHYTVTTTQAVDMFPQTYHVENVVLLEKKTI